MTTLLGRTLRTIRRDRGMTITDVANVTGIDRSVISRLESGDRTRLALSTLRQYVERMDLKETEVVRLGVAAIRPHERNGNAVRTNGRTATERTTT